MKHTQGKWIVDGNQAVTTQYGSIIADIFGDSKEEQEANASFIVKACNSHAELLEACKEYEKTLVALMEGMETKVNVELAWKIVETREKGNKAIKQAEGA